MPHNRAEHGLIGDVTTRRSFVMSGAAASMGARLLFGRSSAAASLAGGAP